MRNAALVAVCVSALLGASASAQVVSQQVVVSGPGEQGPMQMLPPGRQAKTGTAVLRGRVVSADTGAALRRAQVRISGQDIGSKGALTDANGRYEFKDLPAGRFNVSVSKAGFVNMQYGQRRPFEPGRPIELADAQVLEKVDIAMPRGSVLAGRVVDEFGEPVADAMVSAMRMQFMNGRRRLVNAGRTAQTNDLGQYRLYGLAPGEYYVSANLRSFESMMVDMLGSPGGPTGSNQNSGYAPTYYPGTPSPSEAQRVAVAVGQELSSVDIALQPVRLARITGTAMTSDGKPMGGAMILLMPASRDAMMFMPGGTSRTNASGQFTLNGIAPGDYTLQLRSLGAIMSQVAGAATMTFAVKTDEASSSPQQEPEFASVPLSVSGEDISGLLVATTHGAHASGRLTFEGGAKPEGMGTARVTAPPTDMDAASLGVMPSPIRDDGTFDITGLVGNRLIRVANPPKGWYLKAVHLNGEDVTDGGIEMKPGEDVSGLDVQLTQHSTTVTGGVTDDKGEQAKEYTVVVFPRNQQLWSFPVNRWISSARPDQSGQFRITNLPAGSYYAIAVEYVAAGEWGDPDWLQRAQDKATEFSLNEGGTATLDLKLSSM
jgi:protocatechuate 3,4-dioxygenase beta subunit